jgi:uncharacterized small protein (DUF1192 family)
MYSERIKALLEHLNELERKYGRVPAQEDTNYDPSGEVNARIQVLKEDLARLGARMKWDGRQYRIVGEDLEASKD